MSNYSDVNQLLEELGASDRSAADPWTITRHSRTFASGTSFTPAVTADLGEPAAALNAERQAAERIAGADEIVTSPAGGKQSTSKGSTGSGILGGLLDLFPLANVLGRLFGLGGSSSPPPLTPYIAPPSVNFQGAVPATISQSMAESLQGTGARRTQSDVGESNLTYGENGLPKALNEVAQLATPAYSMVGQLAGLSSSNYLEQQVNGYASVIPDGSRGADMSSTDSSSAVFAQAPGTPAQGQSILVQVQAMDSQSFMDHSSDIAQAVRQAMLNMHSVNDVIAEL